MTGKRLVKVFFELDSAAWHGSGTESLWAEEVGGSRYRLRNVPYFAYGVSAEDIVSVEARDGTLFFKAVSIRGGHSTYRLRLDESRKSERFQTYWLPLQSLGCSYEEGEVLAVDVPPSARLTDVRLALEAGEDAGVWEYEEGSCSHLECDSATGV